MSCGRASLAAAFLLVGGGTACSKVPLFDVGVEFALADAAWFEEEETLFLFWDLSAEQGLGSDTVMEIRYETDTEVVDWTPITDRPSVHGHVPVDCGIEGMCGSWSLHVPDEPRFVELRLRYHPDGELARDAVTIFNVVGAGADHTNRSMVVYGVFDELNQHVQWRGRHVFPTIRNQRASALGLRRWFEVADPRSGELVVDDPSNPYAYATGCSAAINDLGLGPISTDERAVFHPAPVPPAASTASIVCGDATVEDGRGTYTATAVARKNPQVRAAFPVLRSPVKDATPIQFFLGPCDRSFDVDHASMQRQRLQMGGVPTTCTDDWDDPDFVRRLAGDFSAAVEATRPRGDDMVLVVALHRDEDGVQDALEDALAMVVPDERHRSTPRLAGAFVFDTAVGVPQRDDLKQVTLWCPASLPDGTGGDPNFASLSCAVNPDEPDFELGPFTFGSLPILPSRRMYNDFVSTYSERQAGEMESLAYRAPRFATTSDHADLGDFGVVTFLNDERITPDRSDEFSFCPSRSLLPVVFRSPFTQSDAFEELLDELCADGSVSEDFCIAGQARVLPLQFLPDWHDALAEADYELGLFWDFPYLLRARYEVFASGSVSAVGLSVPFGLGQTGESFIGSQNWLTEEFWLDERLKQCRRFCDHPTFDSAGVYQVSTPFAPTYRNICYLPDFPTQGDGGFPRDP